MRHFRLYVDECGTDDMVSCHIDKHRYLTLLGVAINMDHIRKAAIPDLAALKDKHFGHIDPDHTVILHRTDFLGFKGPFQALRDETAMANFQAGLCEYLIGLPHTVISVTIDKFEMRNKAHWSLKEPYHYLAGIMAEKFVQFLGRVGGVGDVWAESRKTVKNNALAAEFERACSLGTSYVSADMFKAALTTFDIRFREKEDNVAGLQIADVYAKPSFDLIANLRNSSHPVSAFSRTMWPVLKKKYDRSYYGQIMGYGVKFIP